jgi:hypothetical protein
LHKKEETSLAMKHQAVRAHVSKSELRKSSVSAFPELNGKPISANGLRNGIYKALSLSERVRLYKKLIGDLERAGIRVGSRLFLLGISSGDSRRIDPERHSQVNSFVIPQLTTGHRSNFSNAQRDSIEE